jgi:oligoribonuclease
LSTELLPIDLESGRLFWADCEFTGLKPHEGDKILEIGVLVTDLALRELDAYDTFIHYDWHAVEKLMDRNPWWDERVEDRQRMQAGLAKAPTVNEVDEDVEALIDEYFPDEKPKVHGNSVHYDFHHIIAGQMPRTASRLHYRINDISGLKTDVLNYRGVEYPHKLHKHHALDDIRESVDEYRFLLKTIGLVDLGHFSNGTG